MVYAFLFKFSQGGERMRISGSECFVRIYNQEASITNNLQQTLKKLSSI